MLARSWISHWLQRKPVEHHWATTHQPPGGTLGLVEAVLEGAGDQLVDEDGGDEGGRIPQQRLDQHRRQRLGGEDRQGEEGGAHRDPEARQQEQDEGGHAVDPDELLRHRDRLQPAVGDVPGVDHPPVHEDHGDDPPAEDPEHPPGTVRVGAEEGPQGLDRVVADDGIGAEQEPDDHQGFLGHGREGRVISVLAGGRSEGSRGSTVYRPRHAAARTGRRGWTPLQAARTQSSPA